jgi:hypothetical protein
VKGTTGQLLPYLPWLVRARRHIWLQTLILVSTITPHHLAAAQVRMVVKAVCTVNGGEEWKVETRWGSTGRAFSMPR